MKKLTGILIALLTLCLILSVPAFATESTDEGASETQQPLATPTLVGASLSLEDRVHIWFALYIGEDAPADTEYGMIFWTAEKSNEDDYTMENATKDGATIVKGGESHAAGIDHPELGTLQVREFDYSVAAKEMTDMVYARGYIKNADDSYSYTKMVPYSVQTYAGNMLGIYPGTTKTDDEALVEMIETMLHFGAASQKYFKYRTDDLADTILKWSKGLAYTANGDGTCFVSGIGTCTDTDVYIPKIALNGDCAGKKVTSIGFQAFSACRNLTCITIPNSVTNIGGNAFEECTSLTSITIPESVTSISGSAFNNCIGLASITVDEKNTIYHSVSNCLIETASKTLIAGCENSVIPADGSVTSIGDSAFFDRRGLTSITIPNSVTSIGYSAFFWCTGLTSITIPDGVTSIGDHAFDTCRGLASITIPKSVTSIGEGAFSYCTGLTSITVNAKNTVYHSVDNCLIKTASKTLIAGCKNSVIPTDGSVTSIGNYAFRGCTGLESVTIPNSVTSIGDHAFSDCSGLTSITIPNSVTSIGDDAFSNCSGLTSITIPNSVTSIGGYAFYCTAYYKNNSNWESGVLYIGNHLIDAKTNISGAYNIKEGTKCIADCAFVDCTGLTGITIPNSVTSIGEWAFHNCTSLASITVDSGNPKYCSYGNCLIESATGTIVVGCKNSWIGCVNHSMANVTSIGDDAFYGYTELKGIIISNTVTSIGSRAFAWSGLTDIYYQGTISEWNAVSKGGWWNGGTACVVHCLSNDDYCEFEENIIRLEYLKDDLTNGRQVTLNGTQYDSVTTLYNSFTGTVQDGKFTVEPRAGYWYALNAERTEIYLRQLANVKDRVSAKISAINLFDYGITTGTTPADAYNAAVADIEKIMIQASNTASDSLPEVTTLDDYSFPIAYQRYYTTLYDWTNYRG